MSIDAPFSKNSFSYEDLLLCGHGELFGPGNARLPLPPLLMFDRIISINNDGGEHGNGEIIAELDITDHLWFYKCHFEGDPVMPGCLGLDALWQMLGFFLGWLNRPGPGRPRDLTRRVPPGGGGPEGPGRLQEGGFASAGVSAVGASG